MSKLRWSWTPFLAMALGCAGWLTGIIVCQFLSPLVCGAQTVATQRTVEGIVSGSADAPLPGAVVYLKDLKTLSIRSFISTSDGSYRFGQMASANDYELWADYKGKKSGVKSLSSFDNRKQKIMNLKVDSK